MTENRNIVTDFLSLRLSQRREIAEWVGVRRENPMETDFEFCTRVLTTARDTSKLTELGEKAAAFLAAETR